MWLVLNKGAVRQGMSLEEIEKVIGKPYKRESLTNGTTVCWWYAYSQCAPGKACGLKAYAVTFDARGRAVFVPWKRIRFGERVDTAEIVSIPEDFPPDAHRPLPWRPERRSHDHE
jgi:hypothetical protein